MRYPVNGSPCPVEQILDMSTAAGTPKCRPCKHLTWTAICHACLATKAPCGKGKTVQWIAKGQVQEAAGVSHGQILVLLGVPDVLVDPVADAEELSHVRRNCGMSTHLHAPSPPNPFLPLHSCLLPLTHTFPTHTQLTSSGLLPF